MKITAALFVGWAAGSAWGANVTVRAVVSPVVVIHDGAQARIPVKAGMTLVDADTVIGATDQASVQLECPNGATQTLSAKFHAVINARGAKSKCAIDLKAGTAVATALTAVPNKNTDGDASISGGVYALTSHHTQFGLTVAPGAEASAQASTEAFVVDGEAFVSAGKATAPRSLKQGQLFSSITSKVDRIGEETFQRIATAYTQLDLSQLGRAATDQVAASLQSQWLAALRQPGNVRARQALTNTHRKLRLSASLVSQYQLAQANALAAVANTFQNPMHGEYRLDFCLHYSKTSGAFGGCGGLAANAWCKARGFSKATQWVAARNIGATSPTSVIGDDRICRAAHCNGFASISCE